MSIHGTGDCSKDMSHRKSGGLSEIALRPFLHQAKVNAKARIVKKNRKRSKKKIQTSKKIFTFAFAFSRCVCRKP